VINEAIELFDPVELEKYEIVKADLVTARAHVEGLVVASQKDANRMHNGLATVKRLAAIVEETRKQQVGPLNEQVKALNGTWRPLTDALAALELIAKRKLQVWQQAERERIARAQAAARKAQAEAERREAEALAKAEAAKTSGARDKAMARAGEASQELMQARIAEPMDAPTGIKTDFGTTSTRMVWAFKVANADMVPRHFLAVDEKAIRRAVAEGARSIPGVVIYEEEQLQTRLG